MKKTMPKAYQSMRNTPQPSFITGIKNFIYVIKETIQNMDGH
jgi:hypothetical protein